MKGNYYDVADSKNLGAYVTDPKSVREAMSNVQFQLDSVSGGMIAEGDKPGYDWLDYARLKADFLIEAARDLKAAVDREKILRDAEMGQPCPAEPLNPDRAIWYLGEEHEWGSYQQQWLDYGKSLTAAPEPPGENRRQKLSNESETRAAAL